MRETLPEKSGTSLNEPKPWLAQRIGFSLVLAGSKQKPVRMRGPCSCETSELMTCAGAKVPSGRTGKRKIRPSSLAAYSVRSPATGLISTQVKPTFCAAPSAIFVKRRDGSLLPAVVKETEKALIGFS